MQEKENNYFLYASLFIAPTTALRYRLFFTFKEGI
jgi:hypothetical protein